MPDNIHVLHNGVEKKLKKLPSKTKEILFVGRLVEEKGIKLFIDSLENLADKLYDWRFCIVGSSHLGGNEKNSNFATMGALRAYSNSFFELLVTYEITICPR